MNDYDEVINDTKRHQEIVKQFIFYLIDKLKYRAENHDASKLLPPEIDIFKDFTPKLAKSTYNSDEYKEFLKQMKPALDHHYANNRHHIEHQPNGVRGMNLVDLVEMLCDWKAASMRHNNGNILLSIEVNKTRFNLSDDLVEILRNTVELLEP